MTKIKHLEIMYGCDQCEELDKIIDEAMKSIGFELYAVGNVLTDSVFPFDHKKLRLYKNDIEYREDLEKKITQEIERYEEDVDNV